MISKGLLLALATAIGIAGAIELITISMEPKPYQIEWNHFEP